MKSTLAEEANASCADGLDFTVNGVPLGYDTPLLLAGDKHICSGALNVETADYGFDDASPDCVAARISAPGFPPTSTVEISSRTTTSRT